MTLQLTNNDSANLVFDLINRAEQFGDQNIDVIIYKDECWFRGNDIASILKYERPRKAVSDHVDDNDKSTKYDILKKVVPDQDYQNTNKNQLKTIYINESGLYSLILSSELPSAREFRKWITGNLLPKIRKIGQDKYLQQLQEQSKQLLEQTQLITKLERKQLKLNSFVRNIKMLEKNQIFYISTTQNYARQNRFKYGGVSDYKDLKERLSKYDIGRPEGDLYYYAKLFKCNNFKLIEERVGSVLQQFKDKMGARKEMTYLRYNRFVEVCNFICDNYDREVEYINASCQQFLNETIESEGIVPEPVDIASIVDM